MCPVVSSVLKDPSCILYASSASRSSDDDSETEDELPNTSRGRTGAQKETKTAPKEEATTAASSARRRSSPHGSSADSSNGSALLLPRVPFTRSRSPVVTRAGPSRRHMSPIASRSSRRITLLGPVAFFPATFRFRIPFWPTHWSWIFSADFRKCGESNILMGAILYGAMAISDVSSRPLYAEANGWIIKGEFLALPLFNSSEPLFES